MQQHIYYIKFALHFADMQIPELVTVFNAQVQSRGWSSMRAYHDQALLDEFFASEAAKPSASAAASILLPFIMARQSPSLILSDTIYPITS